MKALHLLLLPALAFVAAAAPISDTTVRQAAARVDRLLEDDLKAAGLKPTGRIDDATFLRRAYLGIIGRIPSIDETTRFLDDPSDDKRHDLIDTLVDSPGFDSHLFNWTADLLRLQTNQEQFGLGWHVWLRKSLAEDKPWDEMVSAMLSSTGHTSSDPAVGYYLRDRNMQLDNFSNTMQVFLGRQIGCAQCHDHPFDDWSQYDYYQMAAFGGGFQYRSRDAADAARKAAMAMVKQPANPKAKPAPASFGPNKKKSQANEQAKKAAAREEARKREEAKRELRKQQQAYQNQIKKVAGTFRPLFSDFNRNAVFDNPDTLLKLPSDYQYKDAKPGDKVPAETLFGTKLKNVAPEDRRDVFAEWVASPENPYFTKVIANRMWQRTFGFGLVDPVDDWSDDSETRHPEVLAYLETTMKGTDYNLREFLRILFHTRLFQRECLTEEPAMGVPLAFRGPVLTRMSAEQIFDSFLVLRNGEISDAGSSKFQRTWDDYQDRISNLLNAPPRDLLVLAESAKQGEEAKRKAQADVREAQKKLAEAKNPQQRKDAQRAIADAKERLSKARKMEMPVMRNLRVNGGGNKSGPLRASEYPAPFGLGSLVREFGGSDRQTPSSGHTTATVPQALALLNDPQTDIVSGKKSRLARELMKCASSEERIDHLFLTLLSRMPTEAERSRYAPMAENPTQLRDLTRAMLTSNRFLFIQ